MKATHVLLTCAVAAVLAASVTSKCTFACMKDFFSCKRGARSMGEDFVSKCCPEYTECLEKCTPGADKPSVCKLATKRGSWNKRMEQVRESFMDDPYYY